MPIQSILIPKHFGLTKAKKWIKDHKFKIIKIHETEHFYRFRQLTPDNNKRYRTKKLKNGIIYVLEF